ncbi:radical SAM protein [Candidatus Parcubacteria bacterium]|nr:MAG: radical SAM protein [Candidatus Parcubacteria bacterium]
MADVLLFNQYYTASMAAPETILAGFPINLLYLATYVREQGVDCKIVELGATEISQSYSDGKRLRCGMSDEMIRTIIRDEQPSVVGIGCMYTRHYPDTLSIAKLVKETDPRIKVVMGGNHVTSFPSVILRNPSVDFVVVGEGEITFYELCKHIIEHKQQYDGILGLAFKQPDGKIVENKRRPLIENLDVLNIDYDLVEIGKYAQITRLSPYLMRYPSMWVTTSRGCPNNCVYCTVKNVYGRTWRGKSARKTVDEWEILIKKHGIREIAVLDDSASVDKVRWNEICDELIKRKVNVKWTTPNGIAHWMLDKPALDKMKKAGCYRVTFGIESGNPETRKYLGKPFPLKQAREMIEYANRIGMWTICTNIIGFPYEDAAAVDDTVRFAQECGTDFATFYTLVPHVTSEVYKDFKKEGLLDFDHLFAGEEFSIEDYERMGEITNDGGTATKYFTVEELKTLQMQAYRSFILYRAATYLLDPLKLLRKIRSVEDFLYMSRLVGMGIMIFFRSFGLKTTKKLLYSKLAEK